MLLSDARNLLEAAPKRLICVYQNSIAAPGNFDWQAVRWRASGTIIVGGSFLSAVDASVLIRQQGIDGVISLENERSDRPLLPPETLLLELPMPDVGAELPDVYLLGILWRRQYCPYSTIYVHCQMGGSRSPGMAYALLRYEGEGKSSILKRFQEIFPTWGEHPFHKAYMDAADAAVAALKGSR